MEKTCTRCHLSKDVSQFSTKGTKADGSIKYSSECKLCHNQYTQDHYNQNKDYYGKKARRNEKKRLDWYTELKKSLSCEICGENHPAVLDFHHKDRTQKDFTISQKRCASKEKFLEELSKCAVLCSNCHRKYHYNENHPELAKLDTAASYEVAD